MELPFVDERGLELFPENFVISNKATLSPVFSPYVCAFCFIFVGNCASVISPSHRDENPSSTPYSSKYPGPLLPILHWPLALLAAVCTFITPVHHIVPLELLSDLHPPLYVFPRYLCLGLHVLQVHAESRLPSSQWDLPWTLPLPCYACSLF